MKAHNLWGDELADTALEPPIQSPVTRVGSRTREAGDVTELDAHRRKKKQEEEGGDQEVSRGDIDEMLELFKGEPRKKTTKSSPASNVIPLRPKRGQVVDQAKFVEKVSNILQGAVESGRLGWQPDPLNGGATERAVINRSTLASLLSGNAESGVGAAGGGAQEYILDAAGSPEGLKLVGQALVLAGLADFTRMGYASKSPVLVAYRTTGK